MDPIKITHLITGLSTGGAEISLLKLLSRMDPGTYRNEVISLTDIGEVGEKIQNLGVPVRTLGMSRRAPNPFDLLTLARWLRGSSPRIVQTWMYHADLIGGLAARLGGAPPVVWGIRHSNLDADCNKRGTIWTARACAVLSRRLPSRILCCSEAARRVHADFGYWAERMEVIPNGFDIEVFRPDQEARLAMRKEMGLSETAFLIGLAGRFHPQKDHRNFVRAAALLRENHPEVHWVLCGEGIARTNPKLAAWIEEAGIGDRCRLLGPLEDMTRFHAALDIATSSSLGEGFPNVVGEAMACAVPCVVTDVGDSARLVGETGLVVPPADSEALAGAWQSLIALGADGRRQLGSSARWRIKEHFSLERMTERFERLYGGMLEEDGQAI